MGAAHDKVPPRRLEDEAPHVGDASLTSAPRTMAYRRTEHPAFSWSHSRQRVFDACRRRYYWQYYAAHNGWERAAPTLARAAWTLKQLTTYAITLGSAVHVQARRIALAVRDRRPVPDYNVLRQSARGTLNRLYLHSRDRAAFLAAPSQRPITADAYYGRVRPSQQFDGLRERLARSLTNLLDQPLWAELAELDAAAVRVVDTMATVGVDRVPVYVAPDLVFRSPRSGWVIVDWKTGAANAVEAQLALYGVYLRDGLGLPSRGGAYEARTVDLRTGRTVTYHLDDGALRSAHERVTQGVEAMRMYVRDVPDNVPLPAAAFPLAQDRRSCSHCHFRELCARELDSI